LKRNNYFPIEGFKQLLKHIVTNQNRINEIILERRLNYKELEFGLKSEINNLTKDEID